MKKNALPALLLPFLAVSLAAAKEFDPELDFNLRLGEAFLAAGQAQPIQDPNQARRINAVRTTLIAMQDGVEVGGMVTDYIKANDVKIEFRMQAETSVLKVDDKGNATIYLGNQVSLYPRVLAPLIARETSRLMVADMPRCSEKHFMARSIEVRSWLELGGDKDRLPVIEPLDGYKDEAQAADFKLWLDNKSEMFLYKIGLLNKTKDLMELESEVQAKLRGLAANDPKRAALEKEYAVLEAANKRFVTFLLAENDWRKGYGQ